MLAASERDGEMEYAIQTTASTGWRPVCAALSLSGSVDAVQETARPHRVRPDCAFDDEGGQAPKAPWVLM